MPSVICLGELLIDLCAVEEDVSLDEARTFVKAPGGAPANVAVGVVRLGRSAGFVGAVGDDPFGRYLEGVLRSAGVDTSGLTKTAAARTTLAWVASRKDGRKDVTFYRNPGADMFLAAGHIRPEQIAEADALHFGSISRIDPSPREATDKARALAAAGGKLITYDPNWRPTLWADHQEARGRIIEGFEGSHVAKVSDEEWEFMTGTSDLASGAKMILDRGCQLVVRSEGAKGASYVTAAHSGHLGPFKVRFVEPTGAGDAFMACLIVELLSHWMKGCQPGSLEKSQLEKIIRRANAVGALATTRIGAIPAMPTAVEVDSFLAGAIASWFDGNRRSRRGE